VLQVFPDASRAGHKEVERLQMRIAHLGAKASGNFILDCDTHMITANVQNTAPGVQPKKFSLMHNSEMPNSTFAVIESHNKQVCLSSDLLFDVLMPRINQVMTSKKNLKIESKGTRFTVDDFIVKIGIVTMSSGQYRGILVEVEYLPCSVPGLCWPLIKEFMQSFMGICGPQHPSPYMQARMNDIYTAQDTIQQYLEKFNEFRDPSFTGGNHP